MQKALDTILRHCVHQELSNGDLDKGSSMKSKIPGQPGFKVDNLAPVEEQDQDLLRSLHQCLEEKGILKEVQGFLRQRLVGVLEGSWPELFDQARKDRHLSPIAVSLVHDFLCSHKLLFTLSVFSTELGHAVEATVEFGKLPAARAETLLEELGVDKDSGRSRRVLDSYFGEGRTSLLEALLGRSGLDFINQVNLTKDRHHETRNDLSLNDKLQKIDEKYADGRKRAKKNNLGHGALESMDARFRALAMSLEREKQIQLQIAIDKFREEESGRLREEIETELKFTVLRKEKELLANYEAQVTHLRSGLEREKALWAAERDQKERELLERRDELVQALQSIRTNQHTTVTDAQSGTGGGINVSEGSGSGKSGPSSGEIVDAGRTKVLPGYDYEGDREAKRYFLLQEAKLRNAIDKLKMENEELKAGARLVDPRDQRPVTPKRNRLNPYHPPSSDTPPPHNTQKQSPGPAPPLQDTDTIAFLRYQVEKQAEELEALKQTSSPLGAESVSVAKNVESAGTMRPGVLSFQVPSELQNTELETFLLEARKRMADIERDAEGVGKTLSKLQERRGRGAAKSVPAADLRQPTMTTNSKPNQNQGSSEPRFQFPPDPLRRPVQPNIPKSRLAPLFPDMTFNPAFLKPELRSSKTDFSIPGEPSKVSFLTTYSDDYRKSNPGPIRQFTAPDIPSNASSDKAKSSHDSDSPLTRISSQKSKPNSVSENDPTLSSRSQSERKRSRSKSKSRGSSTNSKASQLQGHKASESGALIREKVGPMGHDQDSPAPTVPAPTGQGQGEGIHLSNNSVNSDSSHRKIQAAVRASLPHPPELKSPTINPAQNQPNQFSMFPTLRVGSISGSLREPVSSENDTDAEDMNVYEEGRIEGNRLDYDDEDFFA